MTNALFTFFAILIFFGHVLDALLTFFAVRYMGARELNPIARPFADKFAGLPFKIAVALYIIESAWRMREAPPLGIGRKLYLYMGIAAVIAWLPVFWNMRQIEKMGE